MNKIVFTFFFKNISKTVKNFLIKKNLKNYILRDIYLKDIKLITQSVNEIVALIRKKLIILAKHTIFGLRKFRK